MIYNRFASKIILRVILMLLVSSGIVYAFMIAHWWYTGVVLIICLGFIIAELIKHTQRTNQDIARFLAAVDQADYTSNFFVERQGAGFEELHSTFSGVIKALKKARITKESQYQYFKSVIEQVGVGVLSVDSGGEISIMNDHALAMLDMPRFTNWARFKKKSPELAWQLDQLEVGRGTVISLSTGKEVKQLAVNLNEIRVDGNAFRVITFQNIQGELELQEVETWYKLMRILTHEIMNSITPIVSLSETLTQLLQQKQNDINEDSFEDIKTALQTIYKRSNGLLHFVEDYRKLTKIPAPRLAFINVTELLNRVVSLMKAEVEKRGVKLDLQVNNRNLQIKADARLIEQVVINLVQNSLDALEGVNNPRIKLTGSFEESKTLIKIEDNGCGIEKDRMGQIFFPFYSTKEKGSGIGLSLSKHIMKMHDGSISVSSEPGSGTTFYLSF